MDNNSNTYLFMNINMQTCSNCNLSYTEKTVMQCIMRSHPLELVKGRYECCNKKINEPGCTFGKHRSLDENLRHKLRELYLKK